MKARRTSAGRSGRRQGGRAAAPAAPRPRRRGAAPPTSPPAQAPAGAAADLGLEAFQSQIERLYGPRDAARGLPTTFMWFAEEVGELSRALRRTDRSNLVQEFSDTLAWLVTLASLAGVRMAEAAQRYLGGCPRCAATPCACKRRTSKT